VADDCSTDKTMEVINRCSTSTHGLRSCGWCPPPLNLGIAQNWDRSTGYAQGEILVCMAGDDVSRPDRLDEGRGGL
jgi:hypothetical protein